MDIQQDVSLSTPVHRRFILDIFGPRWVYVATMSNDPRISGPQNGGAHATNVATPSGGDAAPDAQLARSARDVYRGRPFVGTIFEGTGRNRSWVATITEECPISLEEAIEAYDLSGKITIETPQKTVELNLGGRGGRDDQEERTVGSRSDIPQHLRREIEEQGKRKARSKLQEEKSELRERLEQEKSRAVNRLESKLATKGERLELMRERVDTLESELDRERRKRREKVDELTRKHRKETESLEEEIRDLKEQLIEEKKRRELETEKSTTEQLAKMALEHDEMSLLMRQLASAIGGQEEKVEALPAARSETGGQEAKQSTDRHTAKSHPEEETTFARANDRGSKSRAATNRTSSEDPDTGGQDTYEQMTKSELIRSALQSIKNQEGYEWAEEAVGADAFAGYGMAEWVQMSDALTRAGATEDAPPDQTAALARGLIDHLAPSYRSQLKVAEPAATASELEEMTHEDLSDDMKTFLEEVLRNLQEQLDAHN